MYQDQKGFACEGDFFRGNLHSHTTGSDGDLTPEESVRAYREHGYSFLCLSEHDRFTDLSGTFDTRDFLILPGLEASAVLVDAYGRELACHHMIGILGTRRMQEEAPHPFRGKDVRRPVPIYQGTWNGPAAAQELCDELRACGCLVTYNHPLWSRVQFSDFADLHGIFALETYNYNCMMESGDGEDFIHYDSMLSRGQHIHCIATDDNHNHKGVPDSFGGSIFVRAESLTRENILNALIAGSYYSAAGNGGPEITDWGIADDCVYVSCSPCDVIDVICTGPIGRNHRILGHGMTSASWPLPESARTVRLCCRDREGRRAFTNALYL